VIRVLVVEDDFRVAQVHASFVNDVRGFTVVGTARSAAEARELADGLRPDLVLLDVYLPDESGLTLLRDLTEDAIMLTAASDSASVRAAFAAGALNYLVKPFTAEQLADRLTAYVRYRRQMSTSDQALSQEDIDGALRLLHDGNRPPARKGQSSVTARLVADALRDARRPSSASEIAVELGIARATAQRYLGMLAQQGVATMRLRYGATGRPEHEYEFRSTPR
jgi:two-component system CitB family response regulator